MKGEKKAQNENRRRIFLAVYYSFEKQSTRANPIFLLNKYLVKMIFSGLGFYCVIFLLLLLSCVRFLFSPRCWFGVANAVSTSQCYFLIFPRGIGRSPLVMMVMEGGKGWG